MCRSSIFALPERLPAIGSLEVLVIEFTFAC
jgi:hypothetical protein